MGKRPAFSPALRRYGLGFRHSHLHKGKKGVTSGGLRILRLSPEPSFSVACFPGQASQPVGVESHFRVGERMLPWKELHDPQEQLEGPERVGPETEKAEMLRNKAGTVGGRADSLAPKR